MARRPLVAGNWKMNGLKASLVEIALVRDAVGSGAAGRAEVALCPPATLVAAAAAICTGSPLAIGGQDCHREKSGAFTGDIAADMLRDAGAAYVILGHSERRMLHAETDADVRAKATAAFAAGLSVILCVGELRAERDAGRALSIVGGQLAGSLPDAPPSGRLVIAYEPVWAIGTGLTPTTADVAEMHGHIRKSLAERIGAEGETVRILYGGSVKPANAAELMAVENVDGALVGGASLKADEFMAIVAAYR